MTYRQKTPVLCFYEYTSKGPWGIETSTDSLMIKIEFPDQVESEFHRAMQALVKARKLVPHRLSWTLKSVLAPQHVAKAPDKEAS